jgi:ATP-dependent Clp protease ATP-binding subunit ClpB
MADIGFDPVYGARPLKRAIQRELETAVAKGILRGDFTDGDEITIDSVEGGIVIRRSGDSTVGSAQASVLAE